MYSLEFVNKNYFYKYNENISRRLYNIAMSRKLLIYTYHLTQGGCDVTHLRPVPSVIKNNPSRQATRRPKTKHSFIWNLTIQRFNKLSYTKLNAKMLGVKAEHIVFCSDSYPHTFSFYQPGRYRYKEEEANSSQVCNQGYIRLCPIKGDYCCFRNGLKRVVDD